LAPEAEMRFKMYVVSYLINIPVYTLSFFCSGILVSPLKKQDFSNYILVRKLQETSTLLFNFQQAAGLGLTVV